MKTLIAVHHFPPRYTGGSEQQAYRFARMLRQRGHEAQVVCVERIDRGPEAGVTWEDDVFDGILVRRLSFNLAKAPDSWRWQYDNPWVGDHMRILLSEKRPDVLHLIGGYLLSGRVLRVAHELGVSTVVSLADFWFLCPRITLLRSDRSLSTVPIDPARCARCIGEEQRRYRFPGRLVPGLMQALWRRRRERVDAIQARLDFLRQTLNKTDAVISPSLFTRSIHIAAGVDPERIHFSRQGQDLAVLTATDLEKTSSKTLRIGYVGQIVWHKGVHVLIDAVRRLPDATLTVRIYGDAAADPRYSRGLRRLAADDPRVTFAGTYRQREEMGRVLRDLDVIVVPSLWYENSPMVILESLAHRTPLVVSNLGSMPEVVRDGVNGLLFEPGDPESLARQLRRLLEDPSLVDRLRAGSAPVRSLEDEVDQLEDIYRRVRARSGGAGEAAP